MSELQFGVSAVFKGHADGSHALVVSCLEAYRELDQSLVSLENFAGLGRCVMTILLP